jgi:hypothetical protein
LIYESLPFDVGISVVTGVVLIVVISVVDEDLILLPIIRYMTIV